MAVTYRLIGGDIDVMIRTDASRIGKEFFITEISGEDPIDIRNGFEVGLQQYNEGQLVTFAREKNIELYSFDEYSKERCVVRQLASNPAGRFNGASSRLTFASTFTFASSNVISVPIVIEATVRFSQADIAAMVLTGNRYTIASSDISDDDYFTLAVEGSDVNEVRFIGEWIVDQGDTIISQAIVLSNAADRCLTVRMELFNENSLTHVNLSVGDLSTMKSVAMAEFGQDAFDVVFGSNLSSGPIYANYFLGIIRNIVVSVANTELINIIDPSAGTNSAGADATVTNVTSVTTISA